MELSALHPQIEREKGKEGGSNEIPGHERRVFNACQSTGQFVYVSVCLVCVCVCVLVPPQKRGSLKGGLRASGRERETEGRNTRHTNARATCVDV